MSESHPLLEFHCNICDQRGAAAMRAFGRETPSCSGCGSTVRFRAVVHCLTTRLFGRSLALSEIPDSPTVRGLGMTDWEGYAGTLAERFDYTNTFLDREPRLDILSPPGDHLERFDFVVSSEVFEHVRAPVQRAFDGAFSLLKPGGFLLLTVPFIRAIRGPDAEPVLAESHYVEVGGDEVLVGRTPDGRIMAVSEKTIEHFADVRESQLLVIGDQPVLIYRRADGSLGWRTDLVFHGGTGETLEMRLFGEQDLVRHLEIAGFEDIRAHDESAEQFGVHWPAKASFPITARRPA